MREEKESRRSMAVRWRSSGLFPLEHCEEMLFVGVVERAAVIGRHGRADADGRRSFCSYGEGGQRRCEFGVSMVLVVDAGSWAATPAREKSWDA